MCSCQKQAKVQYIWTSDDGSRTNTYAKEVIAQAKVKRKGGSYTVVRG